MTDEWLEIAHRYVLLNTSIVEPFLEMHKDELRKTNQIYARNSGLLWKRHVETFPKWLKEKVPIDKGEENDLLKWLAYGPRKQAISCTGFIINGQRFNVEDDKKTTQNSGVSIDATTMCRSSAKDQSQVADVVSYYGVLKEIILLDYHTFQIPLFRCLWANVPNGIRIEDGLTLVNLEESQSQFVKDPFILASQAKQVFYSRERDSSWHVVMMARPRGFYELEYYDRHEYMPIILENNIETRLDDVVEEDQYVRVDCEGTLV
ncbi:uncharacterized protein LOC133034854 [Cannabis sativa]|nr:uncharacterized protein LOC133034854 [Cannabis sativa]